MLILRKIWLKNKTTLSIHSQSTLVSNLMKFSLNLQHQIMKISKALTNISFKWCTSNLIQNQKCSAKELEERKISKFWSWEILTMTSCSKKPFKKLSMRTISTLMLWSRIIKLLNLKTKENLLLKIRDWKVIIKLVDLKSLQFNRVAFKNLNLLITRHLYLI